MNKIVILLFGSLMIFGLSSQASAARGTFVREETDLRSGLNSKLVCDGSTATLGMDLTGFNLHFVPKNCRDAAGNDVEVTDWVIGATSFSGDGDLKSARASGRIHATGLEYERVARNGTITKLKVESMPTGEISFVLERSYPDGTKRTDSGEFR